MFGRESGAFRTLNMVLGAVIASVDQRDSKIYRLVHFAVERTADAGIEFQEFAEHRGTVRQRFLNVARLAFQLAIVYLFDFRAGLGGFDQSDSRHGISS